MLPIEIILLGGDWKQAMPVVPGGSQYAQYNASIKQADFFRNFKTTRLIQNMRVDKESVDYRKQLKMIGTGVSCDHEGKIKLKESMCVNAVDELIDFTFGEKALAEPFTHKDELCGSAILCPKNDDALSVNNRLMV